MPRTPQITDPVFLELRLPASTEEWAEDVLRETDEREGWDCERTPEHLIVRVQANGNCNAIVNAAMWLDELSDALREADIDPMEFTLLATSQPR